MCLHASENPDSCILPGGIICRVAKPPCPSVVGKVQLHTQNIATEYKYTQVITYRVTFRRCSTRLLELDPARSLICLLLLESIAVPHPIHH